MKFKVDRRVHQRTETVSSLAANAGWCEAFCTSKGYGTSGEAHRQSIIVSSFGRASFSYKDGSRFDSGTLQKRKSFPAVNESALMLRP